MLRSDVQRLSGSAERGVLKIVVTRGIGPRGYRPPPRSQTTRIVALYPAPAPPPATRLALRWCETRLGRNARLAGIKHLNRLEQVLAQAEWDDEAIDEGLMLDTEGELVSGTASNVFLVREGVLVTPDLRFCGVLGVMRARSAAGGEGAGHRSQRRAALAAGSGSGERGFHHESDPRHPLGDRARRAALGRRARRAIGCAQALEL